MRLIIGSTSVRWVTLAFACFAILWFVGLDRSLFNPDEGRYAEIPREMIATDDWITPRLNGFKYFEKPPLQYWATAGSYAIFGEHPWTSRLWVGLMGFVCVIAIAAIGAVRFGTKIGLVAAAVLMSSLVFFVGGHVNTLDMGLTCWVTLALCSFLLAQGAPTSTLVRGASYLMWACLALAILSKGVVALVLPAAAITVYSLVNRDFAWLRKMHWAGGVLLFMAITLPWFVTVSIRNPEFPDFFFIHEHIERYLTTSHGRSQPWWIYGPVLAVGLVPWIGLLPATLWHALVRPKSKIADFDSERFLAIWVVTVVVFFSASGSKLPLYILPALPAIALLMARRLIAADSSRLVHELSPALAAGIALVALAISAADLPVKGASPELLIDWADSLLIAGLLLVAGFLAARHLLLKGERVRAIGCVASAAYLGFFAVLLDAEDLSPAYSGARVAEEINRRSGPHTVVYCVGLYDQTLPFYIKKPVKLVGFRGELDFGMRQEPQEWLPDERAFGRAWGEESDALAVMAQGTYERLRKGGVPMQVLYAGERHLLVGRDSPAVSPLRSSVE